MSWKPTLTWEDANKRSQIIKKIRLFFENRGVLEVETPIMSQATVTDVHLESFQCQYNFFKDSSINQSTDLYLQTSPEFHMKRLLASGYGCIFQITKAFRLEAGGRYHNPEFTMLEWYRLGFNQYELMDEVGELLKFILECPDPLRISYQNLFLEKVNIDPLTVTRAELIALIEEYNMLSDWLIIDSIEDSDLLLQFIFSEIIEPMIVNESPCFVFNFPKSQASLAKICDVDDRVAQRFECYYKGVELVNGFNELTNSEVQVQRFQEDNQKRSLKRIPKKVIDERFIMALSEGLPQCSGVALGIDRLVMLALNIEHIDEVITFPIENA